MFIVYKKGYYGQGIYGLYRNPENATDRAKRLAKDENDKYHTWEVFEIELFEDDINSCFCSNDNKPIFSIQGRLGNI